MELLYSMCSWLERAVSYVGYIVKVNVFVLSALEEATACLSPWPKDEN